MKYAIRVLVKAWIIVNEQDTFTLIVISCHRRLQPDIGFFQQATEYPNKLLQDAANNIDTLRKRVEHAMLQSQDVATNRMGINVSNTFLDVMQNM